MDFCSHCIVDPCRLSTFACPISGDETETARWQIYTVETAVCEGHLDDVQALLICDAYQRLLALTVPVRLCLQDSRLRHRSCSRTRADFNVLWSGILSAAIMTVISTLKGCHAARKSWRAKLHAPSSRAIYISGEV